VRFASLGSGSEGNGLVVEVGDTRVLIDCGFGVRDTAARLLRLGIEPASLAAILVTHEHADHVGGVAAFAARYRIPVWLTFGTLEMVGERFSRMDQIYGFDSHDAFAVGIVGLPVPGAAVEVCVANALPGADVDLAQASVERDGQPETCSDDLRGLRRPTEIARVDGRNRPCTQLLGQLPGLRSAQLVEGLVRVPLVPPRTIPVGLAVPREEDRRHAGTLAPAWISASATVSAS